MKKDDLMLNSARKSSEMMVVVENRVQMERGECVLINEECALGHHRGCKLFTALRDHLPSPVQR